MDRLPHLPLKCCPGMHYGTEQDFLFLTIMNLLKMDDKRMCFLAIADLLIMLSGPLIRRSG